MKRVIAILLCLLLVLGGTTACKPDTLTHPVAVTDPDNQPQEQETEKQPQDKEETPKVEQPEEAPDENTEEQPETEEQPTQAAPLNHPFAAEGFKPSTETEGTLKLSGLTKNTDPAATLKGRTISLYTAADQPTFSYVNQEGIAVSEWDWMKAMAEAYGFTLKLTVKKAETSLKAQRVALFAGKKLSLLQFGEKDLAAAMTLAQSAEDYLDETAATDGVSKAVLEQSKKTLFAPKGMVSSLWYNKGLMPQETDPAALAKEKKWTIDTYKAIRDASAENGILPQVADDELAWITLSGKSPLTLLDGKLDSNLNAKTTRELWADLKDLRAEFKTFTPADGVEYSLQAGNAAMTFTATPERGEEQTLQAAPLPAMKEGTAGTVTFAGTFMALPRYQSKKDAPAALTFAETWCNRYAEARAAELFALGMSAEDYVNYVAFAEENGHLIFRSAEIETLAENLLKGAWDPAINQEQEYSKIRTQLNALIDRHNLYY
ncbi:MAG: hypothetical protein IJ995_01680 [Clostridia bacterium]|nr:hypothetical protein [Clostridia bacterium]